MVKDPPLSHIVWIVILDSQSVLMMTNVLMPEESSSALHLGLELEFDSVVEWISWEMNSSSVNPPSLVSAVMAAVPDGNSMVGVMGTMNVKAVSSSVSDVSSASWEV